VIERPAIIAILEDARVGAPEITPNLQEILVYLRKLELRLAVIKDFRLWLKQEIQAACSEFGWRLDDPDWYSSEKESICELDDPDSLIAAHMIQKKLEAMLSP